MEKKYTIGMITGIVLLVLVGVYTTLYNADYMNILDRNPDQKLFLLDFESGKKVEVMMRTSFPDCPYGVLRITATDFTLKCGWHIAGIYSSWTEYWRTYGKNRLTGDEEWWQRNNRKRTLVDFDYEILEDKIIVNRITPFYKGRSGSDGVLNEEFLIYEDGVKLTAEYKTENNAIHRIVYREDKSSDSILFEPYDPYGTFIETKKDINGKKLHIYGEKRGTILLDPSIMLISPDDKIATNLTGGTIHLISNCTAGTGGHSVENVTHFLYWNSTKGWNLTGSVISGYNSSSSNNLTIWYDQTLVLPAYENTWPYFWKSQCCQNGTRDFCVNSSARIIAANVPPTFTAPAINTSLTTANVVTCTLDGDGITTRSRSSGSNAFSHANSITNGVINVTWYVLNSSGTGNLTWTYNTPNLTFTPPYGVANLSKNENIWCAAQLIDSFVNTSLGLQTTSNSTPTNVTNGPPWIHTLNITTDYDWNFINESDWSVYFNLTWEGPQDPDGDRLFVTLTLVNSTGVVAFNISYQEFNSSNKVGFNYSSYDLNYQHPSGNGSLNSSWNFIPGRYKINLTVCETNYSYGAYSNPTNCIQDVSEEYLDFFTYTPTWGPGVSRFRVAPPGSGSGTNLAPMGQDDTYGIFLMTVTGGLGKLNLTMRINHTYAGCLGLRCSPNNSLVSGRYHRGVGEVYNITGNESGRTTVLYDWPDYTSYIWCWMDYYSCSAGTIDQFDFEFIFDPPFNQGGV